MSRRRDSSVGASRNRDRRDSRADRYGGFASSSSQAGAGSGSGDGGRGHRDVLDRYAGGRYAARERRREERSADDGDRRRRRSSRRYRDRGSRTRRDSRRRRPSRSPSASSSDDERSRTRKASRFETFNVEEVLAAQAAASAAPPGHPPQPTGESQPASVLAPPPPGMPYVGGPLSSEALIHLLQQQLQGTAGQPQSSEVHAPTPLADPSAAPSSPPPEEEEREEGAAPQPVVLAAPSRPPPSVEDFIPVVPKSLLGLVRSESAASPPPHGSAEGPVVGSADSAGHDAAAASAAGDGNGLASALIMLEAPVIAPEVERRAREARRAHISGFPPQTTPEELREYFRLLLPEVRRGKTQREVRELALAAGDDESEVREVPANAQTDIDEVKDLTLNMAKTKPFGFIEVSLADIITELVELSQTSPGSFAFPSSDGRSYTVHVRRPRDYEALDGEDETRVVMIGFPPTLPDDKLRAAFEQFGALSEFQSVGGLAYAEFASASDARDCRTDLHGETLGNRMVVVLPMYDWLKVCCLQSGVGITLHDDDPVSGKAALNRLRAAEAAQEADEAAAAAAGDDGEAGHALALLTGSAPVDHMRELLEMRRSLPEVVLRLARTFPHLTPLYGSAQPMLYATRILVLLNLFDEEELVLDSTYSRLLADIESEVERHGRVRELIVPRREARPRAPEMPRLDAVASPEAEAEAIAQLADAKERFRRDWDAYLERQLHPVWGGYGRVFVEYESVEEASHAQQQIAGKLFGGRTVVTAFLYEDILHPPSPMEEQEEDDLGADDAPAVSSAGGEAEASADHLLEAPATLDTTD